MPVMYDTHQPLERDNRKYALYSDNDKADYKPKHRYYLNIHRREAYVTLNLTYLWSYFCYSSNYYLIYIPILAHFTM